MGGDLDRDVADGEGAHDDRSLRERKVRAAMRWCGRMGSRALSRHSTGLARAPAQRVRSELDPAAGDEAVPR